MAMRTGLDGEGPVKRRWRQGLVWPLLWLLNAAAVDRWVCERPAMPAALQVALCLVFGLLTCRGLLLAAEVLGLKGRRPFWGDWPYYVPVAAYALLWGRHNFLNFLYYDEFGRFYTLPLTPSQFLRTLLDPINDHLQPVAKVYWHVIYSVFRIRYIGVATGAFVCAVACIVGAQALVRRALPEMGPVVPAVLATLLAATPHSPHVVLWKGAGDSLLLTMAFFFQT